MGEPVREGGCGCGHVRYRVEGEPASVTPDVAIFTESKMPWVPLPEGIPAFEQYYDFREVLAADKLERLLALVTRRQAGEG